MRRHAAGERLEERRVVVHGRAPAGKVRTRLSFPLWDLAVVLHRLLQDVHVVREPLECLVRNADGRLHRGRLHCGPLRSRTSVLASVRGLPRCRQLVSSCYALFHIGLKKRGDLPPGIFLFSYIFRVKTKGKSDCESFPLSEGEQEPGGRGTENRPWSVEVGGSDGRRGRGWGARAPGAHRPSIPSGPTTAEELTEAKGIAGLRSWPWKRTSSPRQSTTRRSERSRWRSAGRSWRGSRLRSC